MAPNGTSRKTPAPAARTSSGSVNFVSKIALDSVFSDADKKGKLKLKSDTSKSLPKPSKPGNWDSDVTSSKAKEASPLPITAPNQDIALAFSSGHPLTDRADIIRCNHCKRAILRHKAKSHIEACIAKKQEKQRKKKEAKDARDAAARKAERGGVSSDSSDAEEDTTVIDTVSSGAKKTARKTDGSAGAGQAGKKRKAEDGGGDAGPSKKKKKKDEPKAKAPKAKAPVDVEKQCGVELPQGGQCARSLTCKSHSMGAKRAVPGRSAPYDKLLAEYQRKNQAKLQKQQMESQPLAVDDALQEGPVDSDDEKEAVLAAIARSRPMPMWQPTHVPLRSKYKHARLQDMLRNALGGTSGRSMWSTAPPATAGPFSAGPSGQRSSVTESVGREGSVSLAREMSVQG